MTKVKIFTDGGARGNPGNAACAYVVYEESLIKFEQAFFLGTTTNNVAEYSGLLKAVEWSSENNIYEIDFYLDSELVVKQMKGEYQIKDEKLRILYNKIKLKIGDGQLKVTWNHVPRAQNARADFLVNQELDKH